jgi:hypothetical protein
VEAVLGHDGNLVLRDGSNSSVIVMVASSFHLCPPLDLALCLICGSY